jgi:hypothetical protein
MVGKQGEAITRTDRGRPFALAALVLMLGCVSLGTEERRLVLVNAEATADALGRARDYAAAQNVSKLRHEAKARFPSLSDDDLAGIALGWQLLERGPERQVFVVVSFVPKGGNVPAKDVADYLGKRVQAELDGHRESGLK